MSSNRSRSGSVGIVSNLSALAVVVLSVAFAIDYLAGLFGYRPALLCSTLQPVGVLAHTVAIGLGTVGAIVFVLTGFSRFELLLGALIIGVLPGVFLHYLGAGCAS